MLTHLLFRFITVWMGLASPSLATPILNTNTSAPNAFQTLYQPPPSLSASRNQTIPSVGGRFSFITCRPPSLVPTTFLVLSQCEYIIQNLHHGMAFLLRPPTSTADDPGRAYAPYILGTLPQCKLKVQRSRASVFSPLNVWVDSTVLNRWMHEILGHRCYQGGMLRDPDGALGWEFDFYHPYWDVGGREEGTAGE